MQVSGVELPQQQSAEAGAAQPQQASGGIFAAFLKSAIGSANSPLRLEAGTGIGRHIAAEDTSKLADDYQDANAVGESADTIDSEATNGDAPANRQDNPENSDTNTANAEADTPVATPDASAALETALTGQFSQIAIAAASNQQGTTSQAATSTAQQPLLSANAAGAQDAPDESLLNAAREAANGKSNGQNRLTAQVSETPQQLVSRPSTTLAASVAVAAQAGKQQGDGTPTGNNADKISDNSGNLLLNDSANKADRAQNAVRPGAQAAANTPQPKAGDIAQQPTPQGAAFSTLLAQNQSGSAATANRAAAGVVRGPELALPSSPAGLSAGTTAANTLSRPAAPAVPPQVTPRALTGQIAVQIQKSVAQGQDTIKIHLKPAELGRVEIKLDVMQDGRVAATIVADRPETLEMLQRDTRGLQQALQDAGLKSNSADLSFNLGGGNASGEQHADNTGASEAGQDGENTEATADAATDTPRRRAGSGVIDVEV